MKYIAFAISETCWIVRVELVVRCATEYPWPGLNGERSVTYWRIKQFHRHRARAYNTCIRSTMTYGAATWALTQREEQLLQSCDRRMLRQMCGISLQDHVPSHDILRMCCLEDILLTIRRSRMAWFGHVYRRQDLDNPLTKIKNVVAPGNRPRGRPRKTWKECVNQDIRAAGVQESTAEDRAAWNAVMKSLTS